MQHKQLELARIIQLLDSRVLEQDSLFTESVFIEVMVKLKDLLHFLNQLGRRVDFTHDVPEDIGDVTDLVAKVRNAACHETSGDRRVGEITFVFNRIFGGIRHAVTLPTGDVLGSDYQDDVAFYYGSLRIYLKRHIFRAVDEIKNLLDQEIDVQDSPSIEANSSDH